VDEERKDEDEPRERVGEET